MNGAETQNNYRENKDQSGEDQPHIRAHQSVNIRRNLHQRENRIKAHIWEINASKSLSLKKSKHKR